MKTLRRKDTKEFVKYEDGWMWITTLPTILAETANLETLKMIHNKQLNDKCDVIDWDGYEIVNVEIIVKD